MTAAAYTGPLSRAKVEAYIAEQEQRIEAQRTVRDKLQELADDEHRHLLQIEGQLAAFRELVAQRGLVDDVVPTTASADPPAADPHTPVPKAAPGPLTDLQEGIVP